MHHALEEKGPAWLLHVLSSMAENVEAINASWDEHAEQIDEVLSCVARANNTNPVHSPPPPVCRFSPESPLTRAMSGRCPIKNSPPSGE